MGVLKHLWNPCGYVTDMSKCHDAGWKTYSTFGGLVLVSRWFATGHWVRPHLWNSFISFNNKYIKITYRHRIWKTMYLFSSYRSIYLFGPLTPSSPPPCKFILIIQTTIFLAKHLSQTTEPSTIKNVQSSAAITRFWGSKKSIAL